MEKLALAWWGVARRVWGGREWGIVPGRRKDISRDKEVKTV